MKRALVLLALLFAFAMQGVANAGSVTLHPSGFGEHSYAAWKADEGLPDSNGNKDQALYFQKMTTTPTFAAGVAVFKGFEGLPTTALEGLAFDRRVDGHCGAGAPRFNVRVEISPGVRQTVFIGCAGMLVSGTSSHEGRTFERRTFKGPIIPGTIVSLAIVFDEGNDVGQGFVHLDNITVDTTARTYIWTSASDNGNNNAVTSAEMEQILGEPPNVAFTQ